jgi:predicted flap endonuclease-1-like 5' DNA nuclease
VNGLSLLVLIAFALGIVIAYRIGALRGQREERAARVAPLSSIAAAGVAQPVDVAKDPSPTSPTPPYPAANEGHAADIGAEKARLIVSFEAESASLRRRIAGLAAERDHAVELAEDRRRLLRALADAREETARYRQLLVDLENDAPPPLLDSPGAPDDLKLIVGVGPVLERMLQQLGISTYRQIARWSERDIDEFDARLAEFPGRIRRDAWVTQARELHQSKYGERIAPRDRA